MEKTISLLPFNYKTIRITQSRIDKGLLAIPVSLVDLFPKTKTSVDVFLGNISRSSAKSFTPYTSSSGECRIGGMRHFYEQFHLTDGDEVVLQILRDGRYRILTERQFAETVKDFEKGFDQSESEDAADSQLREISKITNTPWQDTLWGEYYRLAQVAANPRRQRTARHRRVRESVPPSLRKLLGELYNGKCQVTGFGFLMKDGKPYFEVHHIEPELGHHLKNIVVVSPNTHAQFTHALVEEYFDDDGWLRRVKFNDMTFQVNQVIDLIPENFEKEVHSAS